MVAEEDKLKTLYKSLVGNPDKEISDKFKKYGITSFKEKLASNKEAADEIGSYAIENKIVKDYDSFYGLIANLAPKDKPTLTPSFDSGLLSTSGFSLATCSNI